MTMTSLTGGAEAVPFPPLDAQSIVTDWEMVTAPKSPGSRQSISPPGAVWPIAKAKVWQGAVRSHAPLSVPTPETNVRDDCAAAGAAISSAMVAAAANATQLRMKVM